MHIVFYVIEDSRHETYRFRILRRVNGGDYYVPDHYITFEDACAAAREYNIAWNDNPSIDNE